MVIIAQFAKPFSVKMVPVAAALTVADDRVFAN